jgi:hypothetical protein
MLSAIAILLSAVALPEGSAPTALEARHFPDQLHAYVWRNWQITPLERMAAAVDAKPDELRALGHAMGLDGPPHISTDQWRRSYITVIRANWHLLPYEQLLQLLDWSPDHLAFTLREDDFLFAKLGQLKPKCEPLRYALPNAAARAREAAIAKIVKENFRDGVGVWEQPMFSFVEELSKPLDKSAAKPRSDAGPRYCYSYFALYGDPLLDTSIDPYPNGYLERLRAIGVNGIWLQGVLFKLAKFPWDESLSEGYETRLRNLNALIARAKRHGMGVYLYLNEPRSMSAAWFQSHPELKGATEGDYASLCTSRPEVQKYLREAVASVFKAAPELAGVFTISASENLTNCWSHYHGETCPRCSGRPPAEVIAEVNALISDGAKEAGANGRVIAWDWGWQDAWATAAIAATPADVALMSVSEWSLPINRGGVANTVGEYSLSAIGPGPRARKHWEAARSHGMRPFAKLQVGTTWELGSVPYLPAVENVGEHGARLREARVAGAMLGWTLGGYPSPNLEVMTRVLDGEAKASVLRDVAVRRYSAGHADAVQAAWREFSTALDEYPYDGAVLYNAPHHVGPANLIWEKPTGYRATMVGFPYDDLASWRGVYPPEVFAAQFAKVADGFDRGVEILRGPSGDIKTVPDAVGRELNVAEAAAIQFRSAANQARFVLARERLASASPGADAAATLDEVELLLKGELDLARRLYAIQTRDSRIGFEATNHYFYTPMDLAEKVLNCRDLLDRWLPAERSRLQAAH